MTGEETAKCIAFLNSSWNNKPLDELGAKAWGRELGRYGFEQVMTVLGSLLRTSRFRPSLADVLAEEKGQRRQQALAESKRRALSPAPSAPAVSPEYLRELMAPILDTTRPTRVEHMVEQEPRTAVGRVGQRRQWGALALMVLAERAARDDGLACDVLDEVSRRALGTGRAAGGER